MIKIENAGVFGIDHAIRGMRNPMNSWDKSDSYPCYDKPHFCDACPALDDCSLQYVSEPFVLGPNDLELALKLAKGGPTHAKYRRMITVYMDITAPLYWWKEMDTYMIGKTQNSCSTMHKIHAREFTLDDFSHEHLTTDEHIPTRTYSTIWVMETTVVNLNILRKLFIETGDKKYWWQMIQLLPSSYNQRRTVMVNYELLHRIFFDRRTHKLDEWRAFCEWIETLPYSNLITQEVIKQDS